MQPEYFARVSLPEALSFARGVQRRYREGWRQARFSAYVVARPHYKELDYDSLLSLPWENESKMPRKEAEKQRAAQLEELKGKIPMYAKILNQNDRGKTDSEATP